MGLVVESKRRNVFRVAGPDVLGPWLLARLAMTPSTLFETTRPARRALLAVPLRRGILVGENTGRPTPVIAPCRAATPAGSA
jgi:hypothetical protein